MLYMIVNCGNGSYIILMLALAARLSLILTAFFARKKSSYFWISTLMIVPVIGASFFFRYLGLVVVDRAVKMSDPVTADALMKQGIQHANQCVILGFKSFYILVPVLLISLLIFYKRNFSGPTK